MSKLLDQAAAALRARADRNGDGTLDKRDVEVVIGQLRATTEQETQRHPLAALVVCAVCAGVVGFGLHATITPACSVAKAASSK